MPPAVAGHARSPAGDEPADGAAAASDAATAPASRIDNTSGWRERRRDRCERRRGDGTLHTAGQPTAATLATLAEQGFELVVNLAPPSSQGAVPDEGKLVAEDGPTYVNIPVSWQQPTYEDFELFSAVMNGARDRKVLVHCQLNMRPSAFTFLYRVIHEGAAPEEALEALRTVWIPRDQWAALTAEVLERHNVAFELPKP